MIGHVKLSGEWEGPGGTPPLRSGGGWVGVPLPKTPSSTLSLPCEIVSISQGRPLLAPEFTTSGQEEAGKGLKIPVCGGSSLHATPFRREAAVHWMPMGVPPDLPTHRKALGASGFIRQVAGSPAHLEAVLQLWDRAPKVAQSLCVLLLHRSTTSSVRPPLPHHQQRQCAASAR
jgi:hypothetical protein